jgi:hypothetical protein
MELKDKKLRCDDCWGEFTFTAGEQEFFFEKGFSEPERCKPCRQKKKSQGT